MYNVFSSTSPWYYHFTLFSSILSITLCKNMVWLDTEPSVTDKPFSHSDQWAYKLFLKKCLNVRTSPPPTPFHQKLITSSTHWWCRQITWRGHVIQGMFPEPVQQVEVFLGRDSSAGLPVFMSRTVAFNTGRNSSGLKWWTCAGTWLGQNGGWNKSRIKKCCQCNYLLCSPKFDKILSFLLKKKVSIDQIFIYSKSWL